EADDPHAQERCRSAVHGEGQEVDDHACGRGEEVRLAAGGRGEEGSRAGGAREEGPGAGDRREEGRFADRGGEEDARAGGGREEGAGAQGDRGGGGRSESACREEGAGTQGDGRQEDGDGSQEALIRRTAATKDARITAGVFFVSASAEAARRSPRTGATALRGYRCCEGAGGVPVVVLTSIRPSM